MLKKYLDLDKKIIFLNHNSKVPLHKNWNNEQNDKEIILNNTYYNLGWRLEDEDLIIDVDPRNNGSESFKKLKQYVGEEFNINVITPSGGYHCYLKKPKDLKIKKNIKGFNGIDFLSKGCQAVIPPSKIDDKKYIPLHFNISEANEKLLELISVKNNNFENDNTININDLPNNFFTDDNIKDLLVNLDPSMPNNDWVKVGLALYRWDSQRGLEIWEEWSKKGTNYTPLETSKRWKSFSHTPEKKVTLGTLIYMNKEKDFEKKQENIDNFISYINCSGLKEIELNVYKKIKESNFAEFEIERLIKTLQQRLKFLTGIKPKITSIREKILKNKNINFNSTGDWYKKWIYLNSHNSFVNLETLQFYKTEAFNIENNIFVKELNQNASTYISKNGLIPVVEKMEYNPQSQEQIYEKDGVKILNSFNHKTLPNSKEISEEGHNYINRLQTHIRFLIGEQNEKLFTEWLAYQFQNKGKKINWCPVIQSVEGMGKSFFANLLKLCLGNKNFRVITPNDIISTYNSWATNSCVTVINELKIQGHNRHDIINELKPLITDDSISIKEKYIQTYNTVNTTNYICFTNYKDAIPINRTDRRYWLLFSPLKNKEHLEFLAGESYSDYFIKLFDGLENHYQEVLTWLLNYEISKEFYKIKVAPENENKENLIATEEMAIEGLIEIKEELEKGGVGITKEAFSSNNLIKQVLFNTEDNNLTTYFSTSKRNFLFKKLGFILYYKKIFWNGKQERIWISNNSLKENDIKIILDKTLT